ncbi:N-6 DNA methylase [Nocardiopsis lambiniae]|uniref:N-6 DNA methylase n=1 Tax=Nocardiopsis lambiniae TaxID=3075539 RepID=A0ABU2M947_9ACTN|nr:N-6 DNA methylase [Nocardiopsis sp. DSM 44743]MDT0329191.1 N-6 DNA methylase [Nocardiopsis sp. DSM 44743]
MDSRDRTTADEQQVTAADIARLAGVTRAAVSNWRRRHDDFPSPVGGTPSSPLFSLSGVRAWLETQNKGVEESTEVRLWHTLRGDHPGRMLPALADTVGYLLDGDRGGLGDEAVRLVEEMASESSPSEVSRALTERFLNAGERAGAPSGSTMRLVRALAALTDATATSVFDPACGTGALLFGVGASGAGRTGQDIDPDAARLVRARSELEHGIEADIRVGDALRSDRWEGHRARLVVCDPPPATTDWGREELLMDPRWELAVPPRAENELAWLQHAYAHTEPGGQAAVVLSTSCAYRRTGRRTRAELVRRGLLTDVVALPAGLAAAHAQPVHLWLLKRPTGTGDAARSVRMWDLSGADPDGPWAWPREGGAEVSLIDLLDDEVDLTPGRHLAPGLEDLPGALASAREGLRRLARSIDGLLPEVSAPGTAEWPGTQVRVGDLVDAGLVDLEGGSPRAVDERLDGDFLRGFIAAPANTRRSTSASGTHRTDARAARVPQMGPADQRRYGAAFRALEEFERRAEELAVLARKTAELTREGLTSGALVPEDHAPGAEG